VKHLCQQTPAVAAQLEAQHALRQRNHGGRHLIFIRAEGYDCSG
jgi:hypothetical protein